MQTLQTEIITQQAMKISHIQHMEITHLLTQVAAGFEGWPSNAVNEFIVRVKAVAADKKRQNTKAARAQENERLRCYGKVLDELIKAGTVSRDSVQIILDRVVESNATRKQLGLAEIELGSKKLPGRPRGSKNKAPKAGGLEKADVVDLEKGAGGAYKQAYPTTDTESNVDEQQRIDVQENEEQVGQQKSQSHPIDEPQHDTGDEQVQQVAEDNQPVEQQIEVQSATTIPDDQGQQPTVDDDEEWAAQFPHIPGTPRAQGGTWLGILKQEREAPKKLGAKWDKPAGQWYTLETDLTPFKPWLRSFFSENPASDQAEDGVQKKRGYLIIPYKEAEQKAKEMGAIYDEDCKRYYVADGDDPQLFVQSGFRIE